MQIIQSSNARAVASLLDARPGRTPRSSGAWHRLSSECGATATRRWPAYARRFDGLNEPIEVTRRELDKGATLVDRGVRKAIAFASRNIRSVAERQRPRPWTVSPVPGVTIRQRVVPLDRVGCYVPGGRYPLPSSLLMAAIPARVAGVPEVIVMCPRPDPTVMYAALEAGVSRLFRLGGAHAIAAMAYGTTTGPARRSHRRPWKRVRRRRQGPGVTRLRHRFLRRPERDRDCVELRQSGMDRRRSHRPGRARP